MGGCNIAMTRGSGWEVVYIISLSTNYVLTEQLSSPSLEILTYL